MTERESHGGRLLGLLTFSCGCAALAMLASGVFGERGVRKHERLERQLAELLERRARAEQENARLSAEARALRESPDYVEWVVRQELGWVAPGERVLRLSR